MFNDPIFVELWKATHATTLFIICIFIFIILFLYKLFEEIVYFTNRKRNNERNDK